MREPDKQENIIWNGLQVQIKIWCDPTDIPYEDCHEDEYKQGYEGWDLAVEAELKYNSSTFNGYDSLCAIWEPHLSVRKALENYIKELTENALLDLENNLKKCSAGEEVKEIKRQEALAIKKQTIANSLLNLFNKNY